MNDYPAFFLECFERLVSHEGGFGDDPKDRGNWTTGVIGKGENKGTKYGISAMTYPDLDIKNLTLDQAKAIYYRDWWIKAGAEYLPKEMVYQVWQFAVNAGMGNAKRVLQRAAGVADDGDIGPRSIEAIQKMDRADLMLLWFKFCVKHYTALSTWLTYGKGWMNRLADALGFAAKDN